MANVVGCSQSSVLYVILSSNPKVVVDFYTPNCVPCKIMDPVLTKILSDPKFDDVTLVKFDASEAEEIHAWAIRAVPTIICFKDKVEVYRQLGVCSQKLLAEMLETVLMSQP